MQKRKVLKNHCPQINTKFWARIKYYRATFIKYTVENVLTYSDDNINSLNIKSIWFYKKSICDK